MYETNMTSMSATRPFYGYPPREHPYDTTTHRSGKPRKLRSACDACHQAKIKCSGGLPCARCTKDGRHCRYSFTARVGKPKGSKNKKTLEKMRLKAQEAGETLNTDQTTADQSPTQQHTPPESASSMTEQRMGSTVSEPDPHTKELSPNFTPIQPVTAMGEFTTDMTSMDFGGFDAPAAVGGWMVPISPSPTTLPDVFDIHTAPVSLPYSNIHPDHHHSATRTPIESIHGDDQSQLLEHFPAHPHSRRASLPLTPNSAQAHAFHLEPTQHSPLAPTLESPELMEEMVCSCLDAQAARMVQLREIEARSSSSPSFDAVINFTPQILRDAESTLRCALCHADPQVLQMGLMNLGTVFAWAEACFDAGDGSDGGMPAVDVCIGNYAVCEDVAGLVRGTVVGSIFAHARAVLVELEQSLAGARRLPTGEVEGQVLFVLGEVRGLRGVLDGLGRGMRGEGRAGRRCKSLNDVGY